MKKQKFSLNTSIKNKHTAAAEGSYQLTHNLKLLRLELNCNRPHK